ncbi:MAG: hypothetical protein UH850_00105 [Paludibacteraceae bacterium]|nr:hypothetical protein [Paludibacteraceae bacterium]
MLSTTDFFKNRLSVDEVKLILIDACIECECDKIAIVYAIEDVDKIISRIDRGDVVLWMLTKDWAFKFFNRILDEDDLELLRDIDELHTIRKMYRIERMDSGFWAIELKMND